MIPLFETVLTKRGFIVALITAAAVLGAGLGLLPGLPGDVDDDSGPATTTEPDSLPGDGTTDATRDVETPRTATIQPPAGTAKTTETATATEDSASPTTDEPPDVSVTPTTSDDSAALGVEQEGNVSVGTKLATPPAVAG